MTTTDYVISFSYVLVYFILINVVLFMIANKVNQWTDDSRLNNSQLNIFALTSMVPISASAFIIALLNFVYLPSKIRVIGFFICLLIMVLGLYILKDVNKHAFYLILPAYLVSVLAIGFTRGSNFSDSYDFHLADNLIKAFLENGFAVLIICILSLTIMHLLSRYSISGMFLRISTYLLSIFVIYIILWQEQTNGTQAIRSLFLAAGFLILMILILQLKYLIIKKTIFMNNEFNYYTDSGLVPFLVSGVLFLTGFAIFQNKFLFFVNTAIFFVPYFFSIAAEAQLVKNSNILIKSRYFMISTAASCMLFAYYLYWLYAVGGIHQILGRADYLTKSLIGI